MREQRQRNGEAHVFVVRAKVTTTMTMHLRERKKRPSSIQTLNIQKKDPKLLCVVFLSFFFSLSSLLLCVFFTPGASS